MNPFTYSYPVKVYFGEKAAKNLAAELTNAGPNVMLAYGIASYRTMERRINAIKANGTDAMIEVFQGLPHGFGLGTGTIAEGWIDRAVEFWERNMKNE